MHQNLRSSLRWGSTGSALFGVIALIKMIIFDISSAGSFVKTQSGWKQMIVTGVLVYDNMVSAKSGTFLIDDS